MRYIIDGGIILGLIILIIIRIFIPDSDFMVAIQYIGLGVAYFDLMASVLVSVRRRGNFTKILIFFLVVLVIYIVVAVLGMAGVAEVLSEMKALDIVTLITLLLSLPKNLYLKLLEEEKMNE